VFAIGIKYFTTFLSRFFKDILAEKGSSEEVRPQV
jgi:hypothetical protein